MHKRRKILRLRRVSGGGGPASTFDPDLTLYYNFATQPNLEPVPIASQDDPEANISQPTLAITRTTIATFLDHDSIIRTVQSGEARFTGTRRVENVALQSNTLQTTWTNSGSVDTQSAGTGPFGSNDANKIAGTGGGSGSALMQQAITLEFSTQYTFSVYLKADQLDWARVRVGNIAPSDIGGYFDLTNGALGASQGSDNDSERIESIGNGWYRCSFTFTTGTSDVEGFLQVFVAEANADNTVTLDATSSILFFGAQVENVSGQSDTSPSEYQATTTAAVAKNYSTDKSGNVITTTGLLVEEARTNLCKQSENIRTTWSFVNVRLNDDILNTATAPDGTVTADKIIDSSAGGTGNVYIAQGFTLTNATNYTFSAFVKKDQLNWALLWVDRGITDASVYFNLASGAIGNVSANVLTDSEFIEDVGNGLFRVGFSVLSDGTSGAVRVYAIETNGNEVVNRDGTSSIFVWGTQLEVGAFPTSYIKTVASSVARNADVVSTASMGWLNESAGTIYASISQPNLTSLNGRIFDLSDTTNDNRRILYVNTSNAVQTIVRATSSTTGNIDSGGDTIVAGTIMQIAIAVAANDLELFTNGNRSGTGDQTVTLPTGLTVLNVGVGLNAGDGPLNGHIQEIRYYNVRKVNQFLEDLSNGNISV